MLGVEYSCTNSNAFRWNNNYMLKTAGYVLLTQQQLVNINSEDEIQFKVWM